MLAYQNLVSLEVVFQEVSCIMVNFSEFSLMQIIIAGGYDALWLLVFDDGSKRQDLEAGTRRPIDRVQQVWQNWTELSVCPLSAVESMEKGARLESIASLSNF